MLTTLKNDCLSITVSDCGAELQSLCAADGTEYLWDAHAPYWHRRSPVLFPAIGALRGGRADSANGEIRLPKHGFCRSAPFTPEKQTDTEAVYLYTDTEETRAAYPYSFEFRVGYRLCGSSVSVTYTVKNTGSGIMPYIVGGHPAFRIPTTEGEAYTDYVVEFAQPETADCPQVDLATGLICDGVRNRLLTNERSFRLNHVLFRGDALIFDRLREHRVRLYSAVSGRGVELAFADFDRLGVWSMMDDQPFVCLEPWLGSPTMNSEDDVFEHKVGVQRLNENECRSHTYTITVL